MSGPRPLCSVLVPLRTEAPGLEDCLQSVVQQSYPQLELIVVDQRAAEPELEQVRALAGSAEYQRRFVRVACERAAAGSQPQRALNRALEIARGEYLFLLNPDERYHPLRIGRMVNEMRESGRRFAYSALAPLRPRDGAAPAVLDRELGGPDFLAPLLPSASFAFLRSFCPVSSGNLAMHRDLAARLGGFAGMQHHYGWDYALRALAIEEPLYVPECLYEFQPRAPLSGDDEALAAAEARLCLWRYFERIAWSPATHASAPTAENWPAVFEHFLDLWDLRRLWDRVLLGAPTGSRTQADASMPPALTPPRPRSPARAMPRQSPAQRRGETPGPASAGFSTLRPAGR